jgi:hypothetical protein
MNDLATPDVDCDMSAVADNVTRLHIGLVNSSSGLAQ